VTNTKAIELFLIYETLDIYNTTNDTCLAGEVVIEVSSGSG